MAQKVRPASDVSNTDWTPTPVYAEINEDPYNDSSYVEASSSAAEFVVKLAALARPAVGPNQPAHVLTTRIDGPSPVLVELYQGATRIAWRICDAPDGFADYTLTLTNQEAARIQYPANPGADPDLRVRVCAVSSSVPPDQTLPVTVPASGGASITFTVSDLPTSAKPSLVQFALSHGGPVGPLTVTVTDPSSTTKTMILQLPNNTGTCTATAFQIFLTDAGASGIQAVNQPSGTITGIYQPKDALSGFSGDPNGTWTLTVTNAGADTGSITAGQLRFGEPSAPLTVTASATPSSGPSPLSVSLDATITGGTPYLVSVDWGDGSAVEWADPANLPLSHSYSIGDYSPVVTAYTAGAGASSDAAGVSVAGSTSQTYTTPGSDTWTAPVGVTAVQPECWGGGGGGARGGGGGGAYSTGVVSVTPGNTYTVVVGAGGATTVRGSDSTFNSTSIVAKGGSAPVGANGGSGGAAGGGTGTTKYSGGDGASAGTPNGGGGGSSAGTGSNGNNGSGTTGGAAPTGGGAGADGVASAPPLGGFAPGGGGGGCHPGGGGGGTGGDGKVVLNW